MRYKITLAAALCAFALSSAAQDKFRISGTFTAAPKEKKVILTYINENGKNVTDSALMIKGKFAISGTTAHGNKAYLELRDLVKTAGRVKSADFAEFYLEKGNYQVMGTDSMKRSAVTGTKAQADFLEYTGKMGTKPAEYRAIANRFMKARSMKDSATMLSIQAQARVLVKSIEGTLDSFIFSHPDSWVTVDLVNAEKAAVIDPKVFDPYYKILSKRVLDGFTGKKLVEKYQKAMQLSLGKSIEFTQPDAKGNLFKLSSLRGKYVLVDFWASWCAPCRAENPHLLKAYNTLKNKGFEIVGISLDESKAAWLKAVEADAMPWIQVSDLNGFKNEVAMRFGISAIPQNVLINPEGIIIAKNLRGEDVTDKLAAFIK